MEYAIARHPHKPNSVAESRLFQKEFKKKRDSYADSLRFVQA